MGALFAVPLARLRGRGGAAGHAVALDAHAGEPLAALRGATAPLTLLVGAERAGLPDDVLAACDRVARIPIAQRVAQRRDGGDRRALRGDARRRRHGP